MKSEIIYKTFFDVCDRQITVYVCDDIKELCKEEKLPWSGDEHELDGFAQYIGDRNIVVVLKYDNTRDVVLHECIHAINILYSTIDEKVDVDNDELYVRYVSWLQNQVLTKFESL